MATTSPRSTRSHTPSNTQQSIESSGIHHGSSPVTMTPGRKIKAMLAAFDTDSESDNATSKPTARPSADRPSRVVDMDSDDDEEDQLPVAPRGRLAARMLASTYSKESGLPEDERSTITRNPSNHILSHKETPGLDSGSDSENDDIVTFGRRGGTTQTRENPSPAMSRNNAASRSPSPLFVPVESPGSTKTAQHDTHATAASPPTSRLQSLVIEKRMKLKRQEEEKLAREQEREQRSMEIDTEGDEDDDDGDEGGEAIQRLTQQPRPMRKASKKALLEMNRETQRMARNMQLAHEATTKKKISIGSFLEKFNKKTAPAPSNSGSVSDTPAQTSDAEALHSTPPTSPIRETRKNWEDKHAATEETTPNLESLLKEDMEMTIDDLLAARNELEALQPSQLEQQTLKEKIVSISTAPKINKPRKKIQVRLSRETIAQNQQHDSESDLEVVTSPHKARRLALFENVTTQKSHKLSNSLRTLKALAQLQSSRKPQPMTQGDLDDILLRKAREQAAQQREEKIAALRAKGVIIQTAEERVRGEEEVEDLVEKAREEADQIAQQEKAASKRAAAKSNGEHVDDIASDEEEEYIEDAEEGSEGTMDSEDGSDEEGEKEQNMKLVDDQAEEDAESEDEDEDVGKQNISKLSLRQRNRSKLVVSDDEEDDKPIDTQVPTTPKPKIPNLGQSNTPLLGLSQAFAATLGNSQDDSQEDSLAQLRKMPGIDLPVSDLFDSDSQGFMRETQCQESGSLDIFAGFPECNTPAVDSPSTKTFTEYSQFPEPTQDNGFVMSPFDQEKRFRHALSTTAGSVISSNRAGGHRKERRRLRRGQIHQDTDNDEDGEPQTKVNAFESMEKRASRPFIKDKSKAKEMVEEAAEESDDEYAGLGGASDEDSGSEDELDRQMINDNSGEIVDEKELAAMNAHHEREQDEFQLNKLMKDITTGALRRKRVGDALDLSDSDDERISRQRAAKRKEFMKMRKALLADEKIGKIAGDPKKAAFMRTIEDMDIDNDSDFLEEGEDTDNCVASQESNNNGNDSSQRDGEPVARKRPFDAVAADSLNRLPVKSRKLARKASMKKPLTLAEIRESVSFLLDGPDTGAASGVPLSSNITPHDAAARSAHSGGIEDDFVGNGETLQADKLDRTSQVDNATQPRRQRGRVVDRLALRRQASSNAASGNKLAFHSNMNSVGPEFKLPPFLQRRSSSGLSVATTKSSSSTSSSSSVVVTESAGVQGSRKGAVNYYAAAREKERELQLKKGLKNSSSSSLIAQRMNMAGGLSGLLGSKPSEWE